MVRYLPLLALMWATQSALHAHHLPPGYEGVDEFEHGSAMLGGLVHPLTGLDHICAMLAVGLWAAQIGGRAIWMVPLTFVSVMGLGGFLGMSGLSLPFAEQGIVASVLVLGVLIAAAIRMPLPASMGLVGLFALCHGYAHGTEMPKMGSGMAYALGFVLSTIVLHAVGIGLGLFSQRRLRPMVVRFAGAAILACGLGLILG